MPVQIDAGDSITLARLSFIKSCKDLLPDNTYRTDPVIDTPSNSA